MAAGSFLTAFTCFSVATMSLFGGGEKPWEPRKIKVSRAFRVVVQRQEIAKEQAH
jgi:hypothetical protein